MYTHSSLKIHAKHITDLNLAKAGHMNICLKKIAGHLMRIFDLVDFAVGAVKEDIRSYGDSICFEQEDIDANIHFSEWLEEYEGTYCDKLESPFENKTKRRHDGIQGQSKGKRRKQSVTDEDSKAEDGSEEEDSSDEEDREFQQVPKGESHDRSEYNGSEEGDYSRRRGWSLNNGNNRKETDRHMIQIKRARPKIKLSRMRGETETHLVQTTLTNSLKDTIMARKEKLAAVDECLSSKNFKPWKT
jgi:hypothetical protein